jgi:polyisoprenoid-binding protein YceI
MDEAPHGAAIRDEEVGSMAQGVREIDGVELPPVGKYELDASHTEVGFVARHMLTKIRGRFTEFEGTIEVGETPDTSSVQVEIKTGSVQTNFGQRDDHLKSADFFEIDEYPVITFRSTAIRHTGGAGFELDGDLTVRDITRSITLTGEYLGTGVDPFGNSYFSAEAQTTVEREDWDLTWNMALETGGVLVGKKVDLVIGVEAKKVG